MIHDDKHPDNSLKIFSRIRPFLSHEVGQEQAIKKNTDGSITVKYRDEAINVKFDRVFSEKSTQEDVFHSIEKEVKGNLFRGISSTILAYGQTGSGKTYTMYGQHKKGEIDYQEIDKMGLIPRILESIVTSSPIESEIYLSFLQIYNEKLDDLLNDDEQKLEIKENDVSGIFIKGLTEYKINQPEEAIWLLARGEKIRAVRQTKMNINSSRSHLILQVRYQSQEDHNGHVYRGKLLLCDLAGSERMTQDVNHKNQHFQELKYINLSLTNLGKVINILSKRSKGSQNLTRKAPISLSHNLSNNNGIKKPRNSSERVKIVPPYRNSKLTRILKQSLESSPSCRVTPKTYIFIALNPSSHQIEESMNSLRFAKNAQNVKISRSAENKISATDLKVIKNLKQEIIFLKDVLGMKTRAGNFSEILWKYKSLEKENQKLRKIVARRGRSDRDLGEGESHHGMDIQKLYNENRKLKNVISKIGIEIENEESQLSKKLEFLSEMNISMESDPKVDDPILSKSVFSDVSKVSKSARLGSQPRAYENKNSSIFFKKKKKKMRPLQLELQYSKVGISTDMRTGVIRDTASPRRINRGKFDRVRTKGSESNKVDYSSKFKNFSELKSFREARMKTEMKNIGRLPVIRKKKKQGEYPGTTAVSPVKPKARLKIDRRRRSFSSNNNGLKMKAHRVENSDEGGSKTKFFFSPKFGGSMDSMQSNRKHSKSALVRHPRSDVITKNRMKLPPARMNSIGFGSQSTGNLKKQRRKIAEYDKRLEYFKRQLQDMRSDA